ncbi:MAG: hypothetical protein AAF654_13290 [Myxococcota bacterium]
MGEMCRVVESIQHRDLSATVEHVLAGSADPSEHHLLPDALAVAQVLLRFEAEEGSGIERFALEFCDAWPPEAPFELASAPQLARRLAELARRCASHAVAGLCDGPVAGGESLYLEKRRTLQLCAFIAENTMNADEFSALAARCDVAVIEGSRRFARASESAAWVVELECAA